MSTPEAVDPTCTQRSNNLLPRDSESYIAAELIGRLQKHAQNASIIVSVDEASNRLMALSGDGLVVGQQHTLLIQQLGVDLLCQFAVLLLLLLLLLLHCWFAAAAGCLLLLRSLPNSPRRRVESNGGGPPPRHLKPTLKRPKSSTGARDHPQYIAKARQLR